MRSTRMIGARGGSLLLAFALVACGDDGGQGDDNWNANRNWNANQNLGAACPGSLEPLAPAGRVEVVGSGTSASCTEAALHAAVASVTAEEAGGTVTFDCGGAITLVLTQPVVIDGSLILDGGGEVTLSGGGAVRVLEAANYTDLALQRLRIVDGRAEESGAGLLHPWYGTLRAVDVRFENNHCTSETHDVGGGAVFAGGLSAAVFSGCTFVGNSASNGGGLLNRGSDLTVTGCSFIGNRATSTGDGQYGNGGGLYIDGMNYDVPGDLHLCGTVFAENQANTHGSAVFSYFYEGSRSYVDQCQFVDNHFDGSPTGGAGGFYHEAVPLLLTRSTFARNRSDKHAAAVFIGSGSTADIQSCTFADNVVPEVGAALFSGASPVAITNCTFAGNDADYGPAVFQGETAVISVRNTIFAYNTTPNPYSALACHATLEDGGGNVQWPEEKPSGNPDNPCAEGVLFVDPLLEPLGDNGGPTLTMALSPDSSAVDHASGCPETDQRGEPRVGACDSGAYEHQP